MDINHTEHTSEEKIVRLSLSWLILGLIGIATLGVMGGAIGQQLVNPPLPPLTGPTERLITTVQEVTLSPSIAASNIVKESERSILAIVQKDLSGNLKMLATGMVVTSDGLVVTPGRLNNANVSAVGADGQELELLPVGTDNIYGLSYWRIKDGVFVPLEIRREDAPIATDLIALTRSQNTLLNKIASFRITEYALPEGNLPIGIQRAMKGNAISDNTMEGSPLVDDAGKIAGLLINGTQGIAVSASTLRESMDRVIKGEHEFNPFTETGITPLYDFKQVNDTGLKQFTVTVAAVAPQSPAALAGLNTGDVITKINDDELDWPHNLANKLSRQLPFKITVLRQKEEHTLTLNKITE